MVTLAPARAAASAIAKPILPEERLVITRTGSMASLVGPAVSKRLLPCKGLGAKKALSSLSNSCGSNIRPEPTSPQACSPAAGPSIWTRSEERRVGKEGRERGRAERERKESG